MSPYRGTGRDAGTHVALVAVVGRLVLHATLVGDLLPCSQQLLSQDLDVLDGLHQAVSEGEECVVKGVNKHPPEGGGEDAILT